MSTQAVADHPRPWLDHYPEGIDWAIEVDTTPVHEQVLATCARMPDAAAIDFLGKTTRYRELGHDINVLAAALQTRYGVTKGTRVALLLPNTPFFAIAYYAVLRAGGVVVNCNPLYTVGELAHIVGSSGAELMVTVDLKVVFDKAEALVTAGHVKSLIVCHFPTALPPLKSILFSLFKRRDLSKVSASGIADKTADYGKLVASNGTPSPVAIDAHKDVAVQQYTGGTTGIPKGAMLSHANIAANVAQSRAWFDRIFQPGHHGIAVLPFFHIFAMTTCLNIPFITGMQMFLMPRFELKPFLALLTRSRAIVLPAVPTLISAMARNSTVTREHFAHVEVVVSGGASLPDELRKAFGKKSDATLIEGYGLTEASPVVCCGPLDGINKPLSIGLPFPATDVRFVDVDTGQPAAQGERGELQLKGPQVMLGYHNDPAATEAAFQDGWLRTGDVGYMDDEGYVFLVDRIKDIIIVSGFNVYPRAIEEALMTHEAVEEVTAIGVPNEMKGEVPVAFVKLMADAAITEGELKAFLDGRLNKLEMPHRIIFKDSLPKTLIGKLSKKELREEYSQMSGKSREPS